MRQKHELSYKDLKECCNANTFDFETTAELEDNDKGIGQERAIRALEFGLNVDVRGNNLYLEGPTGVGKTMYTRKYLEKISAKKKTPLDWCYIYNFENPNSPIAVSLAPGLGKEFKETMDTFIKDVRADISKTFSNDDYEKEKSLIRQEFEQKREELLQKLNDKAAKYNFTVKTAQNGVYMMPVYEGKALEDFVHILLRAVVKAHIDAVFAAGGVDIHDALGQRIGAFGEFQHVVGFDFALALAEPAADELILFGFGGAGRFGDGDVGLSAGSRVSCAFGPGRFDVGNLHPVFRQADAPAVGALFGQIGILVHGPVCESGRG